MTLSRFDASDAIEDVGDLLVLVSIPFVVLLSLLAVFGFTTLAAAVSILVFVGVVPLVVLFGDSLLARIRDESEPADPVADLRERYVEGELSEAQLERAIDRKLSADNTERDEDSAVERERLTEREER